VECLLRFVCFLIIIASKIVVQFCTTKKNLGMRVFWLLCVRLFFVSIHNFCFAEVPERYDVVIDEIMVDPTPQVRLPLSEFIELKNVSSQPYDLFKWKISDESTTATITSHFILMPDSFVVICPTSAQTSLLAFGFAIGVNNFPSLNNDEDLISLTSSEGKLIHAVKYNVKWFNNAIKAEGGWSLEMIDTRNSCTGNNNWSGSIAADGGTPGRMNSIDGIMQDKQSPSLLRCFASDSNTVTVIFDETLDSNSAANKANYSIDHGVGNPVSAMAQSPLFREITLRFSNSIHHEIIYQLTATGVTDCSNNMIGQMNMSRVGLSVEADTMDVVINEILFNPPSDGFDYVEFYNRSEKILDGSHLFIANRSTAGIISSPKKLSNDPFLIFPGDYVVVSENTESLQLQYLVKNVHQVLEVNSLPSFADDKGAVVLLNEAGLKIDEVDYDEQWHFPLLRNKEGVALERIDAFALSQSRSNWTSAASTAGFGTPTYQNSQSIQAGSTSGRISISPSTFSPDNDGYNDICLIYYEMNEPNDVASIRVYDINGIEVRKIYNNITLSQKGYLTWNGLGESNKALPAGIYIVRTNIFNPGGKTMTFKNVVVLAKKF